MWKKVGSQGMGKFISLKDGDAIEGVFWGEPYTYWRTYPDKTEYSDWAEGRRFNFKTNFIVTEEGERKAKILQGSKTFYNSICDVLEEYGQDSVFKIKRSGSGKDDTRYSVLHKGKLSVNQVVEIKKVRLEELSSGRKRDESSKAEKDEGLPF